MNDRPWCAGDEAENEVANLQTLEVGATGNLFIDALPPASAARLLQQLEPQDVQIGLPIVNTGSVIEHVLFPTRGIISMVKTMRDGGSIEVMLIGREGFFGLPVLLGDKTNSNDAMVQSEGLLLRIRTAEFLSSVRSDAVLMNQSLRYAQTTFTSVAQFSACNRLHPVNERCARWLLMAHDRVVGDELMLTHEYLATMLGVRRPAVTLACAALEQGGFIDYHRGRIVVRDRRGLEEATCECYEVVNDDSDRLLGYSARKLPSPQR